MYVCMLLCYIRYYSTGGGILEYSIIGCWLELSIYIHGPGPWAQAVGMP